MSKNKGKTLELFDLVEGLELRPEVVEDLHEQVKQCQEGTLKTHTAEEVILKLKREHGET